MLYNKNVFKSYAYILRLTKSVDIYKDKTYFSTSFRKTPVLQKNLKPFLKNTLEG